MVQKPRMPWIIHLLIVLVVFGLAALGQAAYAAFLQVAFLSQALPSAVLIEAGMILESVALIRRNWIAVPGLFVSLLVSGTYNYIQAQQHGALASPPLTDSFQLAMLAIGPLSALFFAALTLGFEISRHEQRVAAWEAHQAQAMADRKAREESFADRMERQRQEANAAHEAAERAERVRIEEMRLANERMIAQDRLRFEERQRRREFKSASVMARPAVTGGGDSDTGATPVNANDTGTASYEEFAAAQVARNGTGPMAHQEIVARFGVSRRTAFRWLARFEREHAPDQTPLPISEN